MPPVAEYKKSPAAHIFPQHLANHCCQPLVAFAHITRLYRHKHPQTSRKTQHGRTTPNARIISPANAACLGVPTCSRTPPPRSMFNLSSSLAFSATASTQFTFRTCLGASASFSLRRALPAQRTNVENLIPSLTASWRFVIPLLASAARISSCFFRGVRTGLPVPVFSPSVAFFKFVIL